MAALLLKIVFCLCYVYIFSQKISQCFKMDVLFQGAESKIFIQEYLGQTMLIKERFSKKYRNQQLDENITKERMKAECRNIVRCKQAGVRTPCIYFVDMNKRLIYMEYFKDGETVKSVINRLQASNSENDKKELNRLMDIIGTELGKMHSKGIIHGDLTSSNILYVNKELVFIDFGLSSCNASAEDIGVDLYVLERALLSTHADVKQCFAVILQSYKNKVGKLAKEYIAKFEEVKLRGRKRTMVG